MILVTKCYLILINFLLNIVKYSQYNIENTFAKCTKNIKNLTFKNFMRYNLFIKMKGRHISVRRIISACLLQTMRFDTTKGTNPERDMEEYLQKLNRHGVKYTIESKEVEKDRSIIVKVKKQYNSYSTDGYLE